MKLKFLKMYHCYKLNAFKIISLLHDHFNPITECQIKEDMMKNKDCTLKYMIKWNDQKEV